MAIISLLKHVLSSCMPCFVSAIRLFGETRFCSIADSVSAVVTSEKQGIAHFPFLVISGITSQKHFVSSFTFSVFGAVTLDPIFCQTRWAHSTRASRVCYEDDDVECII